MFCASHELCGERVPLLRYFYPNTVKTRCLRGSAFLARLCLPKLPAYLLEFADFFYRFFEDFMPFEVFCYEYIFKGRGQNLGKLRIDAKV